MPDISSIRERFPHLAECNYLNTAAVGLGWRGQGAAAAEFYEADKIKGAGGASNWHRRFDQARARLAELLHVPAETVGFFSSTTEAINLLALSLPLVLGDEVVVAEDEFASVVQPWLALERNGIRLRRVPIEDEDRRTPTLAAAIGRQTRVLAVSHVHWRTGTRINLETLRDSCRKHDCRLIVDGVQAVGAVSVDAALADAYCGSVFKWLLGGFGLSFLAVSEELSQQLTPMVRGYANAVPSRALRYAHLNYPGIYVLHASLELLRSIGWRYIHARVADLAQRTIDGLGAQGFQVVTPQHTHAGIVSIRLPDVSQVVQALADRGIVVENGGAFLRASPHFYNTEDELDGFVTALTELIPGPARSGTG